MHYLIIGNGISGTTAACTLRKNDPSSEITLVSEEYPYFYSRTALMYCFMGRLTVQDTEPYERSFYKSNRLMHVQDRAVQFDFDAHHVTLSSGQTVPYDKLLLAVGSKPRTADWPGVNLDGITGFYGIPDLKRLLSFSSGAKQAVVVGGGLIGIEAVEILNSRGIKTTFLIREPSYFPLALSAEESERVVARLRSHGIQVILGDEAAEFEGTAGRLNAVRTRNGAILPCQVAVISIGVTPNIEQFKSGPLATGRGILVNDKLETSIPGVYAAGDCAEIADNPGQKPRLEQLWYTGRKQGTVAGLNMCGASESYQRGFLYNSAKFLDIDFHTFGRVNQHLPEESSLFLAHLDGMRSIRLVQAAGALVGVNCLGIRLRENVIRQWIESGASAAMCRERLPEAFFDEEFSSQRLARLSEAPHA